MPLLPPLVVGPLSECSRSVRLRNQLTGSHVKIYSGGRLVADAVAPWSDHVFPLLPGQSLNPGEEVVATQDYGSGPSPTTPEPFVRVLTKTPPGPLSVLAPPYGCGQSVWIKGAVPGAEVTVKEGATTLGTGEADGTGVHIRLSPPISMGGVLLAEQEACALKSGVTAFPPAPSPRMDRALPAPVVDPLRECQRAIRVSGVLVGARVIVERSSGTTHADSFYYPDLTFNAIAPPLSRGEIVTARQEFPTCQLSSPRSAPVTVGPSTPLPVPKILPPVCAGAAAVHIDKLLVGSKVRVLADDTEIGVAEASMPIVTFPVPPLKTGQTLTAQQELCGIWSNKSNKVVVGPVIGWEPRIVSPYACGAVVRASSVQGGSWVTVHSKKLGGEIGRAFAIGADFGNVDVSVAPLLIEGDAIFAVTHGCSTQRGAEVPVLPAPQDLEAPAIGRAMQQMNVVQVGGRTASGARVDVFVHGLLRGSAFCSLGPYSTQVPITGFLQLGDQVAARQSLCTRISPLTDPPFVVEAPPVAGFIPSTASGEVPLKVDFTNRSLGQVNYNMWDFEGKNRIDSVVKSPLYTYRTVGSYKATLTVEGRGGTSIAWAWIQVKSATVGYSRVAVTNCNSARRPVNVWLHDLTDNLWTDHGEMAHQWDSSGVVCPAVGAPKVVILKDQHLYTVVCVDKGNPGCGGDPTDPDCQRFVSGPFRGKTGGGILQHRVD